MVEPSKEKHEGWIRTKNQLTEAERKQEQFNIREAIKFLRERGYRNFKYFTNVDDIFKKWKHIKAPGGIVKLIDSNGAVVITPGKKLSEEVIDELAKHIRLLTGKWLIYAQRKSVDEVWRKIEKLAKDRKIWEAKVSTAASSKNSHVICVYTKNYFDEKDVMSVRETLRSIGIENELSYKPDIYTVLGIYSDTKDMFGLSRICKYRS